MTNVEKEESTEVVLKKPWTWDKVFKEFGSEIQTQLEQLGELYSYQQAAVIFVQEKGFTVGLPR